MTTKRKAPEDLLPEGRPSAYQEPYAEQAFKLCLLGATDTEIADFFEVATSTIYLWKKKHPEFSEALAKGKVKADAEVAHSLYNRANGYSHEAVKIFMPAGAQKPVYAAYVEHYPPDTNAATLWLKNRQKDKWRDSQEITGDLTISTLAERIAAARQRDGEDR
jgi:hypothetical protein